MERNESSKKYTKIVLIAGFAGLSVYFAFAGGVMQIGDDAIGYLSGEIKSAGYPYKDVWTSKDVSYYLTPLNETVQNCEVHLDDTFIKSNNVTYIAFYSTVPRHADINRTLGYCSKSNLLVLYGYHVGFACKTDMSKI